MIPYDISNQKKEEFIAQGFIIETFFGDLSEIKKIAIKKKCQSYLFDNKIIRLDK